MELIQQVTKVAETTRYAEVNEFLKIGWKLIAIAPGVVPDTQEPWIKYSLGWPQALPAEYPDLRKL